MTAKTSDRRRDELRAIEWVIDRSGVAGELEELLRPDGRGRPRDLSVHTFLVGVLLAARRGGLRLTNIHRVLTEDVNLTNQRRLGVLFARSGDPSGKPGRQISYDHLSRLLCALARKADRCETDLLEDIANRLIAASTDAGPAHSGDWAIDVTGVDTWSLGSSSSNPSDPDAAWGYRTATLNKGNSEQFFGYDLYGFVAVPPLGISGKGHPALMGRIAVRAAASKEAETSIAAIDMMRTAGTPVNKVIVDRGFSYKTAATWANKLRARGISQVLDMHAAERGRVDHHGISMIDGTPHCPATPETLVQIKRPGPGATTQEREQFADAIDQRQRYAMRRTQGWRTSKRTGIAAQRYECPAEAGQMRCPLKKHSMVLPDEIPLVLNPPSPNVAPSACTQRTIAVDDSAQPKLRQDDLWGSPAWAADFGRRSHVEGIFGTIENPSVGGLHRGAFAVVGRPKVTLMLAAIVVAVNLHLITRWLEPDRHRKNRHRRASKGAAPWDPDTGSVEHTETGTADRCGCGCVHGADRLPGRDLPDS